MVSPSQEITVKPEVMFLEDLLQDIASGRLRVPRFQRPFVWRPGQMLDLFDSIEHGYPIGGLLVWDTPLHLRSLGQIAEIEVPPAQDADRVSYLLDGHQRLSTLFGSLVRRPRTQSSDQRDWKWQIYRELGLPRGVDDSRPSLFRHWPKDDDPPRNYLPMHVVLRTLDFLGFTRNLTGLEEAGDIDQWIDEAETVAQRIKSYKIAVVRLVGGDLRHAVEVFSRLNSSGQSITPDQMVSALAYPSDDGESLTERIVVIQEGVSDLGFGQLPSLTIFRCVLAVVGETDIQTARWEALADRVKGSLAEHVLHTEVALRRALLFHREQGVTLARLVPYQLHIVLLTAFFNACPEPSPQQREELKRWFWATSWAGYFAGANSTQVKAALSEMRDFAAGRGRLSWRDLIARPFPDRFDQRSARVRAYLIWELNTFGQRLGLDGERVDARGLLAESEGRAYRQVVTTGPGRSSPGNRLVLPTGFGESVLSGLCAIQGSLLHPVLESHGIPTQAFEALRQGRYERFIRERATALAAREREFMSSLGVTLPNDLMGDADIDTE